MPPAIPHGATRPPYAASPPSRPGAHTVDHTLTPTPAAGAMNLPPDGSDLACGCGVGGARCGAVWRLDGTARRGYPSKAVFDSWGPHAEPTVMSCAQLERLPVGPPMEGESDQVPGLESGVHMRASVCNEGLVQCSSQAQISYFLTQWLSMMQVSLITCIVFVHFQNMQP
jgi:hypothetical protein